MKALSLRIEAGMMLGTIAIVVLMATPESPAQSQNSEAFVSGEPLVVPSPLLPPPLSTAREQYFRDHPAAWSQFLAQLPRTDGSPQPTPPQAAAPLAGGTWQSTCCTSFFPSNPLLLTDGTVIAHGGNSADWYKLTPDINGSYVNGSWSQIASLPVIDGTQYAPLYFASAVLPDGRVLIMGGEYNGGVGDHTTMGAIYDPLADSWSAVAPPTGPAWFAIGDAQSTVLADGTFMLAACCAGSPTADALFDAATLGWTATGGPSNSYSYSYQDEQGYELLPNGNVLTIDIWDSYPTGNTTNAEQYEPASGTWISAGNTPVPLADSYECGNWEIGPAVMRPDGTLVAFGGNTGCKGVPKPDPTAIYDTANGTWSAGRNIPALCGTGGKTSCSLADAPAALLPSGNILFAASAGAGSQPTHFFEFTSSDTIVQVADSVYCAASEPGYAVNFLVLPNGQILATDLCNAPEFYTPTGVAKAGWAPVITGHPKKVTPGDSYTISGTQFNGLSQGAYYGDDVQGATNYPIVRITNVATGHVFYARTANHSTMSIAPGTAGSTTFTVPSTIETGRSELVVIANGIASKHVTITVE